MYIKINGLNETVDDYTAMCIITGELDINPKKAYCIDFKILISEIISFIRKLEISRLNEIKKIHEFIKNNAKNIVRDSNIEQIYERCEITQELVNILASENILRVIFMRMIGEKALDVIINNTDLFRDYHDNRVEYPIYIENEIIKKHKNKILKFFSYVKSEQLIMSLIVKNREELKTFSEKMKENIYNSIKPIISLDERILYIMPKEEVKKLITEEITNKIEKHFNDDDDEKIKDVIISSIDNVNCWMVILEKNILKKVLEGLFYAIKRKIETNPIKSLCRTEEINMIPNGDILYKINGFNSFLNNNKYSIVNGDYDFVHYDDEQGRKRKKRIGKAMIDKGFVDLAEEYKKIKNYIGKNIVLEIVISQNPIDILAKSTGQTWWSCESIDGNFGGTGMDKKCGWRDDIINNNLICYIREKGKTKWLGRTMIRWAISYINKDIKAIAERYYGDVPYKQIMREFLFKLFRENNLLVEDGEPFCCCCEDDNCNECNDYCDECEGCKYDSFICETPYKYTGYCDGGTSNNGRLMYSESFSRWDE